MTRAKLLVLFLGCALVAGSGVTVMAAASGGTGATPMCPSIGAGAGCAYVLTVNPSGSVSIAAGTNPASYDGRGEGDDVVVGVVNNSNAIVSSIALTGTSNVFGFDGDGICTETFTSPVSSSYCQTNGPNGGPSFTTTRGRTTGINPYDYQGPDNTFKNITTSGRTAGSGTISFTSALLPQATTFLSLEAAPTRSTATAVLQTGLQVSTPAITPAPVEGGLWSGQVTTFTDKGSISPASEFQATINWGDGSCNPNASSPGTITEVSPGSYVVSGAHTYCDEGTDSVTVAVTDPPLQAYTAGNVATVTSSPGPVTVADAPLTPGPAVVIAPQQTNVPFTTSATFTDGNAAATAADFAQTTISWGDGTTSTTTSSTDPVVVTGSGGSFTVSGTHAYTSNTANDPNGAEPKPVSFNIVDIGGSTTTVTSNNVAVADSVTACSTGTTCSGSVNPTSTQPVSATVGTSTGQSGDLLVSTNANTGQGQLNCGDGFLHAPSVLSESNTFSAPQGTITSTESFPVSVGVVLNPGAPGTPGDSSAFWVCFQANQSFTDVSGQAAPESTDPSTGATVYTGLLPLCDPLHADVGPCVNYISTAPNGSNVLTVTEVITYPASFASSSDPKRV